MFRFFMIAMLIGCIPNRAFRKDFTALSESTCVDGVVLNIYEAGCLSTYVGRTGYGDTTLKIRCSYSKKKSWWTERSFYITPSGDIAHSTNWKLHCLDQYVNVYSSPSG